MFFAIQNITIYNLFILFPASIIYSIFIIYSHLILDLLINDILLIVIANSFIILFMPFSLKVTLLYHINMMHSLGFYIVFFKTLIEYFHQL